MNYKELKPFLYQHGRLTGIVKGDPKQYWGVITRIEKHFTSLVDHYDHFHIFENAFIKDFKFNLISTKHKEPKLKCDCGHKSEDRFTCERCGKTFCGDCGCQKWVQTENKDVCFKCLQLINNH